jgi:hypothetical protein
MFPANQIGKLNWDTKGLKSFRDVIPAPGLRFFPERARPEEAIIHGCTEK